jgi:hypothetical protein
MRTIGKMALALLLAGAGPALAQPDPIVTREQGYRLRLMGDGLAAGQVGLHSYPVFLFGIPRSEAMQRVDGLVGPDSATGTGRGCGARPLAFARFGTPTLWFRGERWVGWSLAGPRAAPPIESEWGTGSGTVRGEIADSDADEPVFRRTARGIQFHAGGMDGLLSGPGPRARVTALWSGETCRR